MYHDSEYLAVLMMHIIIFGPAYDNTSTIKVKMLMTMTNSGMVLSTDHVGVDAAAVEHWKLESLTNSEKERRKRFLHIFIDRNSRVFPVIFLDRPTIAVRATREFTRLEGATRHPQQTLDR